MVYTFDYSDPPNVPYLPGTVPNSERTPNPKPEGGLGAWLGSIEQALAKCLRPGAALILLRQRPNVRRRRRRTKTAPLNKELVIRGKRGFV